jgi:hypothetical protein
MVLILTTLNITCMRARSPAAPRQEILSNASMSFRRTFLAHSFTILRLKAVR